MRIFKRARSDWKRKLGSHCHASSAEAEGPTPYPMPSHSMMAPVSDSCTWNLASVTCSATQIAVLVCGQNEMHWAFGTQALLKY